MEIKLKRYHQIYIILLEGELDLYNAPELEKVFQNLIKKGVKSFVLDLGNINYIDSSGVGMLLKLNSITKEENLDFVMSTVEGEVLNVLNLTNLIKFFPIEPGYREALKKLLNKTSTANGVAIND